MATKLEKPLKRELVVNDAPYMLTIAPEGLKLVPKGKRSPNSPGKSPAMWQVPSRRQHLLPLQGLWVVPVEMSSDSGFYALPLLSQPLSAKACLNCWSPTIS